MILQPEFTQIATFEITIGPLVDAGSGQRMIPVLGGTVRGARLNGTILPGGADWQQPGGSGVVKIGGRWIMETDDHVRIQVETPGIRHASSEVLSELAAGRDIDPSRYYFRVAPQFVVNHAQYSWLEQLLFVGLGAKRPSGVVIDVFSMA